MVVKLKKVYVLLISLFFLPISVLAYSNSIILGGDTIGIEVKTDGIMVIGFYEINGKYNRGTPTIKSGDYILKVNDNIINNVSDLTKYIEKYVDDGNINVLVRSNNIEKNIKLDLIYDNGIYKTGLYVKDSISGIGTLTYIDPNTKIFGALGHEIIESNSNSIVEVKTGKILESKITSIDKSSSGYAGSKNAKFNYNNVYGDIFKNSISGIFGNYLSIIPDREVIDVAQNWEVKLGNASIYTVIDTNKIEKYDIEITSINESSKNKNITFRIVDEYLINKTGGIVQGMSGSPIVQNNKIVGAITHVITDNPITGYGIFIRSMLEEGEKNNQN